MKVPLDVLNAVIVSVDAKLAVPLFGLKMPVAPTGRPVTDREIDGSPVMEEPGANVTVTRYVFEPVVSICKLVGDAATV